MWLSAKGPHWTDLSQPRLHFASTLWQSWAACQDLHTPCVPSLPVHSVINSLSMKGSFNLLLPIFVLVICCSLLKLDVITIDYVFSYFCSWKLFPSFNPQALLWYKWNLSSVTDQGLKVCLTLALFTPHVLYCF